MITARGFQRLPTQGGWAHRKRTPEKAIEGVGIYRITDEKVTPVFETLTPNPMMKNYLIEIEGG